MSHKNKTGLHDQANEVFKSLAAFGVSKDEIKREAGKEYKELSKSLDMIMTQKEYVDSKLRDKIFSYKTYENYAKHNNYFLDYCKEEHHCKTLEQCREYVDEWIQQRIDDGYSPYTIKLETAGLAKLYQEPTSNFIETPERSRSEITRSRDNVQRDYGFSETNNAEFIAFCRGTGLRREEISQLRGTQLIEKEDGFYLGVTGKGGRYREAIIVGNHVDEIVDRCRNAGTDKVWESVPSHADIHSYRSEYITDIYLANARELDTLSPEEKYYCRGDMKGQVFDREAMAIASHMAGHSRISVIASHYLRGI